MYRYIANRVLLAIPTLVGAAALVFVLMRLIPGDICVVRLGSGGGNVDPRAVAACHAELGLERPVILQFVDFVWNFSRLDFGISMWSGKPVAEEIAARLPISLEIAVMATVVAIVISIPLGTISALKQNSWIDHVVRTTAIAGIATPSSGSESSPSWPFSTSRMQYSARPGCPRSTTSRSGRIRFAICRWSSCQRLRSVTATPLSPCG